MSKFECTPNQAPRSIRCDYVRTTGRKRGVACGLPARFYALLRRINLCGVHAPIVRADSPLRDGTGSPWYDGGVCATLGHDDRQATRVEPSLMCRTCSFDFELEGLRATKRAATRLAGAR